MSVLHPSASHAATVARAPATCGEGGTATALLTIRSPWMPVQAWVINGRDDKGRPVCQYVRLPVGHPGLMSAGGAVELTLPDGFTGAVELLDSRRVSLGKVNLQNLGRPGFSAQSRGLEARVTGPQEILVDRLSQPIRCYVRCAADAQAQQIAIQSADGNEELISVGQGAGSSFLLSPGFRGLIQLLDAQGQALAKFSVGSGGAAVQARARPGLLAESHTTERLIELRLSRAGLSPSCQHRALQTKGSSHE